MKQLKTLTQTDITGIVDYLTHNIVKTWHPQVIIAIAKGGYIPARLLAKKLNVTRIYSYGISFYDVNNQKLEIPAVYQDLEGCSKLLTPQTKILIVDDIADTGDSMLACWNHLQQLGCINVIDPVIPSNIRTCSLYAKNRSKVIPDYFFDTIDDSTWTVFPWE